MTPQFPSKSPRSPVPGPPSEHGGRTPRSPVPRLPSLTFSLPALILYTLAILFTGIALLQLGLLDELPPTGYFALPVLIGCIGVSLFLMYRVGWQGDALLLPLVFFLCGLGLAMIARLAPAFITRQLIWLPIATAFLLAITLLPQNLNWLRRYKYTWLGGGLLLLATTLLFGVNPSGFGARLWLNVLGSGIYFQPSEPLKLLLVIFLAAYLADRRRQLVEVKAYIAGVGVPHPSYFGPMLLMWGFSIILLVWQRDLGAALLFFGTFLGMLYAATGQSRYIWAGGLLLTVVGAMGYNLFDVVQIRVEAFANPWLDPAGRSFQIVQSLLAFASGGFFGEGLGQGLPTAIPVVHTDFVYAAIGEEYGLLGAVAILLCFVMIIGRAFHIALNAKNGFEQLLAAGIGTMLGLQVLVITAGTLKLMPLTGVTLPFVSYGGSSIVTSFIMIGVLLYISSENRRKERKRSPLSRTPKRTRPLLLLARGLLFLFAVVAVGLILWQVVAAPFLIEREDNPRPIIAEQQIERGSLLTEDGQPIAESIITEDGLAERVYPYPDLSSVTGYYSLRYGLGGTEAAFDPVLRGTADLTPQQAWLNELLHRPLEGDDITVTIDLDAQVAADNALTNVGDEGAAVVMDLDTGAIIVMSSHPTYDPNTLDENWDELRQDEQAPLFNRATQGQFPLGDLARLVGLIGLYQSGATVPAEPMTAPLEELVAPLGELGYLATAHQLGLDEPLPGLRSQPGLLPDFDANGTPRDLAATPLHVARIIGALEQDGQLITPRLSLQRIGGAEQVFSEATAQRVRALLPQVDEQLIGLNGQATPLETGQASLSWFVGLAPTTASPEEADIYRGGELTFDPTLIEETPTPEAQAQVERQAARYVVVVVVATETPEDNPALQVAQSVLDVVVGE